MELRKESIPLKLSNGAFVEVVVKNIGKEIEENIEEEYDVAFKSYYFKEITKVIEGIAQEIESSIKKVKSTKTIVEFGLEIGAEPGKLLFTLVEGSSKAGLKITFEWSEKSLEDKP